MTDIGRKGENEYVRDFEKKCRKNTFFCVAIPIVIGIALLTITKLGVISLLLGPEKIQGEVDYEALENKYVTFDMKYVLERFGEKKVKSKKTNKTTTSRIYYIIYNEEDDTVFGLDMLAYQSSKMNKRIDDTWEWRDGTTNDVEGSITIKGTLEKMPYQIGTYFESTYNDMFEEGFDEMAQLYFINSGNIIANGDVTVTGACIWTIVAACVLIYMIYIIVYTMIGKHDKHIRKYLQKNPSVSMAQLDADFEKAQQISKDIYVGKHWTFYIQGRNIKILDNTKLVWAYHYVRTGKHSVSELVTYDVNKQYVSIPSSRKDGEKILENFSHNQPQIIAGYDKEIENMYYKDFNTLLDYRYNKYSQKDNNLMIENQ